MSFRTGRPFKKTQYELEKEYWLTYSRKGYDYELSSDPITFVLGSLYHNFVPTFYSGNTACRRRYIVPLFFLLLGLLICRSLGLLILVIKSVIYFCSNFVLNRLHLFSTLIANCRKIMSLSGNTVQELFREGGSRVNGSASEVARLLARFSDEQKVADFTSPLFSYFREIGKKGDLFMTKSLKDRLMGLGESSDRKFLTFSNVSLAVNEAKEDLKTETFIPLAELVDIDGAERKLASSQEKKFKDIQGKIVSIDLINLTSTLLAPRCNSGAVLVMAVDGRCSDPASAILGGHIHCNHVAETAESLFFPLFKLSSRDRYLDRAIKIISIGKGFNVEAGSVVAEIRPFVAGEVSQRASTSHLNKGLLKYLEGRFDTVSTYKAIPIIPRVPQGTEFNHFDLNWKGFSGSLSYDAASSSGGSTTWKPSALGKSSSVRFEFNPRIPGSTPLKAQLEQTEALSDDNNFGFGTFERDRIQGETLTMSDSSAPVERGPDLSGSRIENSHLLRSMTIVVPKEVSPGRVFFTLPLFDGLLKGAVMPALMDCLMSSAVDPIFRFSLGVSVSQMSTLPILMYWENERMTRVDSSFNVKRLLSLPSCLTNLHDAEKTLDLIVRPNGHTGLFSPLASDDDLIGQLGISSLGHKLKIQGTLTLTLDVYLEPGSILYRTGDTVQLPNQIERNICFQLVNELHLNSLTANLVLGIYNFDANSAKDESYLISVLPAHGYTQDKGSKVYCAPVAGIFKMWNFWRGEVEVEVVVTSRKNVGGSCTLFQVPTNCPSNLMTRTVLTRQKHMTVDFGKTVKKREKFSFNSWLGGNLTKGNDDFNLLDKLAGEASMMLTLNQPPISEGVGFIAPEVFVLVRIVGFSNLTLFERSSRVKQSYSQVGPGITEEAFKRAQYIPADNPSTSDGVQGLSSSGNEGFSRLLVAIPHLDDNDRDTMQQLVIPAGLSLSKKIFGKDIYSMKDPGALKQGSVNLDPLFVYKDLVCAWTHYSCDIEYLIIPIYEPNAIGHLTAVHKLNPLDNCAYGIQTSVFEAEMGGGINVSIDTRNSPIKFTVPRRHIMYRSRMREKQHQKYLDSGGCIFIRFPNDSSISSIEVYARPVNTIMLGGAAWSNLDFGRGEPTRYRELSLYYGILPEA
ncbi:TPA_asm: polyprotein [Gymnema sylvestre virus 1]|uniref:Polyprotein n=1 Tax=Gymnema sylvestre virus 1 TaxID=2998508 RepID=A0AA48P7Y4_9SECO|nr:TPA_asm: polyprotein [Gymnema sylvestre virus 1]